MMTTTTMVMTTTTTMEEKENEFVAATVRSRSWRSFMNENLHRNTISFYCTTIYSYISNLSVAVGIGFGFIIYPAGFDGLIHSSNKREYKTSHKQDPNSIEHYKRNTTTV